MDWLIGLAGLWVFFQWVLPIAVLLVIAFYAYRWAKRRNAEFASSESERRDLGDRP
ncbi:hypothetical protein D3C72_161180 [compost metagenome]